MRPLKILLVDDNPEFLEVAARFLADHHRLKVAGLAGSGREALRLVRELAPDLVLMDLSMPELNGLEATRQIKALPRPPKVVILTMHEGPEILAFTREAGADAGITKSEFGDGLRPLIQRLFPKLRLTHAHECA